MNLLLRRTLILLKIHSAFNSHYAKYKISVRHCEERSNLLYNLSVAIKRAGDCFGGLAMTSNIQNVQVCDATKDSQRFTAWYKKLFEITDDVFDHLIFAGPLACNHFIGAICLNGCGSCFTD